MEAETIKIRVLNKKPDASQSIAPPEPILLARQIEQLLRKLHGAYLSEDGRKIDYICMRQDSLYSTKLMDLFNMLCIMELDAVRGLPEYARKAFFINIYNALSTCALAQLTVVSDAADRSMLDEKNFWSTYAFNIAGLDLTLDDIEHGVLRANKPHPSKVGTQSEYFSGPQRMREKSLALGELDPRIHFALNCGALSCPRISVFNASNEEQLDLALQNAASSYLENEVQIEIDPAQNRGVVKLPRLLLWYGTDFLSAEYAKRNEKEKNLQLVRIVAELLDEKSEKRQKIMELLRYSSAANDTVSSDIKDVNTTLRILVEFLPYDWTKNHA